MQLHQIKPKNKIQKKKRVGRGGKRGASCGRGMKGQKSRAGKKLKPVVRGWIKRYPKARGHRQKKVIRGREADMAVLNLDVLEEKFSNQGKVTPEELLKKGMINKIKKRIPLVKILGRGKITKALIVENCRVSRSAKEKIEKSGGAIK